MLEDVEIIELRLAAAECNNLITCNKYSIKKEGGGKFLKFMIEINNKTRSYINFKLINEVTEKFLKYYKLGEKEVSIAFVGDVTIRKMNKQYRKKDKATDILSFEGESDFLGEIIIDYAQIKRQAKKYGKKVQDELVFILVHGLLHLLGYDDKTDKGADKMERLGNEFIKKNLSKK